MKSSLVFSLISNKGVCLSGFKKTESGKIIAECSDLLTFTPLGTV